jgi:diguanylate cyclase (GGDEF)-like protein
MPPGSEEAITQRLSKKINAAVLQFANEKLSLSVSIGVACYADDESPQSTLIRADDALYKAKETKGNREHSIQFA